MSGTFKDDWPVQPYMGSAVKRGVKRRQELFRRGDPKVSAYLVCQNISSLTQSHLKAFHKFFTGAFLSVNTRNLLDPPNPPVAVLLYYGRVLAVHQNTSTFVDSIDLEFFGMVWIGSKASRAMKIPLSGPDRSPWR